MPEVRSGTERLNAALLQAVLIGNRTAAGYLLDYGADIEARADPFPLVRGAFVAVYRGEMQL